MKNVIDVDKLFENFMRRYVAEHKGQYQENEWFDMLPDLYEKFESTPLKELGGKTPSTYYDDETDLVGLWLKYIETGTPVNDYIVDAVAGRVPEVEILALVTEDADEEVLLSAIEVLRRKDSENAVNRCIDLLFSKKVCHHVKDEMVEDVVFAADRVKDELLSRLAGKPVDGMFAEVLSHCSTKDERIKRILLDGLKRGDKVPEYAAYLVNYDDESCLEEMVGYLDTLTDYVSYKELKIAIEALGGQVDSDRDFSFDKDYIKLKAAKYDSDKDN